MSGNQDDNKIVKTDQIPMPAEGGTEFTDRPPHRRNKPE